jgi:hypothetical protein
LQGEVGWGALDLRVKSDPTPTLPCEQGREHIEAAWREAVSALLLPLLAGGGWEGVALDLRAKSDPTPALPCEQGREHIEAA